MSWWSKREPDPVRPLEGEEDRKKLVREVYQRAGFPPLAPDERASFVYHQRLYVIDRKLRVAEDGDTKRNTGGRLPEEEFRAVQRERGYDSTMQTLILSMSGDEYHLFWAHTETWMDQHKGLLQVPSPSACFNQARELARRDLEAIDTTLLVTLNQRRR
jgi:hypothetical protein